jgi:hypothetical protein
VTSRSILAGGCLALAMLTAAGCAQVNEAINSRDLECNEVPEDMCVRLADHAVGHWDAANDVQNGPIVRIVVRPIGCGDFEHEGMPRRPGMVRCWGAEAWAEGGAGVGVGYYQNADGRIFDHDGEVVGN